jgi:hypothetical protein
MDDIKLIEAAKIDIDTFEKEWERQNGPTSGAITGPKYLSYRSLDVDDVRNAMKRTGKKGGGSVGGGSGGPNLGTAPTNVAGWLRTGLQTQYGMGREGEFKEREFKTLDSVADIFLTKENKMKSIGQIAKDFASDMGMELVLHLTQQNELLTNLNTKTGMLEGLSKGFRDEITKSGPPAIKLGISFQELSDSVIELVANSGKFKLLSSDTMNEMALASKFTDGMKDMAKMAGNFEKVGMGVKDMALVVEKMGIKSMGLGLNARSTTKLIDENLKNLNSYGFKGGVEGLNRMVQKSIEFRMNMDAVTKVADKVWDPENALSMVANLQVMGGAFGALNDPIKMMYMATNDVGGLQDAIIGAAKSLATYNQEQGRFEVTGINLRRAKAMADEFGMSMEELTTTAVAGMERTQAASDLMGRGFNMKDEDREFLTNLAQMKDGRMVIEVPENLQKVLGGKEVALESLNKDQYDVLIEQKELLKDKTMPEIAREQVSLVENMNRDLSYIVALMRVQAGKQGEEVYKKLFPGVNLNNVVDDMDKIISKAPDLISKIHILPQTNQKGEILAEAGSANVSNVNNKVEEKTKQEPTESRIKQDVTLTIKAGDVVYDDLMRKMTMHEMLNQDPRSFISTSKPR